MRLDNVRSEVDIISDLAIGICGEGQLKFSEFKDHNNIRDAIANTIPGFKKIGDI